MAECALWQRFGSNGSLVREFLRKLVGDEGLKILEAVPEGEVTDEELAKRTDVKLTEVRKVLYTLYDCRIAEYRTEKDDESGWITYWWRIDFGRVKHLIMQDIERKLKELQARIERERSGMFYQCKCQRISFEEAAAMNFWCDECNMPLEYVDNKPLIRQLEEQIEVLERWMRRLKRE